MVMPWNGTSTACADAGVMGQVSSAEAGQTHQHLFCPRVPLLLIENCRTRTPRHCRLPPLDAMRKLYTLERVEGVHWRDATSKAAKLSAPLAALLDSMLEPDVTNRAALQDVQRSQWFHLPLPPKLQVRAGWPACSDDWQVLFIYGQEVNVYAAEYAGFDHTQLLCDQTFDSIIVL